jgi:hypothetical protein
MKMKVKISYYGKNQGSNSQIHLSKLMFHPCSGTAGKKLMILLTRSPLITVTWNGKDQAKTKITQVYGDHKVLSQWEFNKEV